MINETLLNSNVLRRIYTDSTFRAAQTKSAGLSALRSDNKESGSRLIDEALAEQANAQTAYNELTLRGESLR
jgi:hypothetical protein